VPENCGMRLGILV